ncbi:MAG: hypothetical protein O2923_13340, partial [Verrucomicrobia bacterium]|nr:hypothetical protein [Verrucomicrobiota bacterium]
ELKNTAPPTKKQLNFLKKLGATVDDRLSASQASDLISELDGNQSPTKRQIEYIKMLGGEVPTTKREAAALSDRLTATASATSEQRKQAQEIDVSLPEDATFLQANEILGAAESELTRKRASHQPSLRSARS